MSDGRRFFLTTAIDYPNSRPHIGTAFEKLGADVQARYRRMEGFAVHFLMGNDENTVKVSKRAAELEVGVQAYCDDMAAQFKEVWRALDISFDAFVQTSEPRHHVCARTFLQKVHDNGYIYKGQYAGLYCEGCESFKTETDIKEAGGVCPDHKVPPVKRAEPCYFFALSKFQDRLLEHFEKHPDFIQPESRRNEIVSYVKSGLQDINISRSGQAWGIKVPFDEAFTIWVWFDALLTYFTGIGYGTDDAEWARWWPCDIHFIGKDITRFHCAQWPAMLMAAGIEPPRMVFGHGFVYRKSDETGAREKLSKTLGNVIDPMEIITKFRCDAFRYYFLRECPYPGDGEFSWGRFADLFNADLANNLGNLYSRVVTLIAKNFGGCLAKTGGTQPNASAVEGNLAGTVHEIRGHVEACRYSMALEVLWRRILDPANRYADKTEPWKLVKTDAEAAKGVLFALVEPLRQAAILLKPFIPRSAEVIYRSFNFKQPWETVRYADAVSYPGQAEDLKVLAELENGKVKALFPRIS
jgi:methionyl-tRNA synthetase